jgi:hypothetical protein
MRQTDTRPGYWADMLPDGSEALAGVFTVRDYYAGTMDPLYAVASTYYLGADPDALDRLADRLDREADGARIAHPDPYARAQRDADDMAALAGWCRDRAAADRGQA